MKELTKAVVALDIETRSRPKEAAFAGLIPIMTTFAFAAIVPEHELPYLFIGKMDVMSQVDSGNFHSDPDTENWWLTSERIAQAVRESQLRTWNNAEPLYAMVGPVLNDVFNTGNTMSFIGSRQFEDVSQIFRSHLGKEPHALGNGPEFDMGIFDLHFPDHKVYRFTEVGSARTLKWLARQRFSPETYGYLVKNAEEYAKWVFSNLPKSLIEHFDLVPNYHDALFDALAEAHLSHAILTDAIN
ncbi:hypothetical protein [Providencia phage PSTCR5]|uniref:Metallopeptidase n=1 Tax=Providencia phage PSTCR5 TaxID=2783547 RepID=A0A873WL82_9CAUD|nr:hypothetical protein KNV68_gp122 [Providencia phage PSTCR5]QPB12236.1 hypothetical protein [Providencia phage PSTCR5]